MSSKLSYSDTMVEQIKVKIDDYSISYNRFQKDLKEFLSSELPAFKIQDKVLGDDDLTNAIRTVHTSLSHCQAMLGSYYQLNADITADIALYKSLRDTLTIKLVTSPELIAKFKSKTDRADRANLELSDFLTNFETLRALGTRIKSLHDYAHELKDDLNRLDSALRLKVNAANTKVSNEPQLGISEADSLIDNQDSINQLVVE